jgi:hypothetical protein
VEEKWINIKSVLNDICEYTTGYPDKEISYGYHTTHRILLKTEASED